MLSHIVEMKAENPPKIIELKCEFHIECHLMIFMTGKLNIDKIITLYLFINLVVKSSAI